MELTKLLNEDEQKLSLALSKLVPNTPVDVAQAKVEQELYNLEYRMMYKPELAECDKASFMFAMRKVIKDGLSFDISDDHVYLMPLNVKQPDGKYKKIIEVKYTASGNLKKAYIDGLIVDHKTPIVTYTDGENPKVKEVSFSVKKHSGEWEQFVFGELFFSKLRRASHKKHGASKNDADMNKLNYANANYTSFNGCIDPEFAATKAINHGLHKLRGIGYYDKKDVTNTPSEPVIESNANYDVSDIVTPPEPIVVPELEPEPAVVAEYDFSDFKQVVEKANTKEALVEIYNSLPDGLRQNAEVKSILNAREQAIRLAAISSNEF